jgi:hypothetical protein
VCSFPGSAERERWCGGAEWRCGDFELGAECACGAGYAMAARLQKASIDFRKSWRMLGSARQAVMDTLSLGSVPEVARLNPADIMKC